ncbi:MAG: 1-deoxy-D-xylulose-5-phosphate reductoisomerase [Lachnospiraceae bacterium]
MGDIRKHIAVLGSTGSIGTQTLDIVRAQNDLEVVALAAGTNIDRLESQIREFHPALAAVYDRGQAKRLAVRVADTATKIVSGMEGLLEVATCEKSEVLVTAIVGMIGIQPTMAAIEAGKDVALANKETLVTAGHLIMPAAKSKGVSILPVDSEHSAIFQSLNGEDPKSVSRLLLTASGGPFLHKTRSELADIRPQDALKHPNWVMGSKITIDSSTLVNKGLEVMEAKWLFGVELSQIEVVVHPQSIIHSMVEYHDGSIIAQLGVPDMKLPIQYALYYPHRMPMAGERVNFAKIGQLTFEEPDLNSFPGLRLAYQALRSGGLMPTIYNAANEYAVDRFLKERISYLEIPEMIAFAMERQQNTACPSIEEILEGERQTREVLRGTWVERD